MYIIRPGRRRCCFARVSLWRVLLAATSRLGPDTYFALIYENGILKILAIKTAASLFSIYFIGYYLQTDHTLSVQNRPTGLAEVWSPP